MRDTYTSICQADSSIAKQVMVLPSRLWYCQAGYGIAKKATVLPSRQKCQMMVRKPVILNKR